MSGNLMRSPRMNPDEPVRRDRRAPGQKAGEVQNDYAGRAL
jgi:hypothetical protein